MLYPLAWLAAAIIAVVFHAQLQEAFPNIPDTPFLVGLGTFILGIVSGVLVLNYSRLAKETRDSIRIRLTRQRRKSSVKRLRELRSELFDQFMALKEGLTLPDDVTDVLD